MSTFLIDLNITYVTQSNSQIYYIHSSKFHTYHSERNFHGNNIIEQIIHTIVRNLLIYLIFKYFEII